MFFFKLKIDLIWKILIDRCFFLFFIFFYIQLPRINVLFFLLFYFGRESRLTDLSFSQKQTACKLAAILIGTCVTWWVQRGENWKERCSKDWPPMDRVSSAVWPDSLKMEEGFLRACTTWRQPVSRSTIL